MVWFIISSFKNSVMWRWKVAANPGEVTSGKFISYGDAHLDLVCRKNEV